MTKIAAENKSAPQAGDTPLRGRCVGCSLPLAIHPSECPGPWRRPPCETDVPTPITWTAKNRQQNQAHRK